MFFFISSRKLVGMKRDRVKHGFISTLVCLSSSWDKFQINLSGLWWRNEFLEIAANILEFFFSSLKIQENISGMRQHKLHNLKLKSLAHLLLFWGGGVGGVFLELGLS